MASLSQAIDQLSTRARAQKVQLIGYSGGGALATLLAARRKDVEGLITVAGVLDVEAWTRGEGLTPLWRSLNPAGAVDGLRSIRQIHFVGQLDRDVPPRIAVSFARRFGPGASPSVVELPGYDHHCCWVRDWPALLIRAERESRVP